MIHILFPCWCKQQPQIIPCSTIRTRRKWGNHVGRFFPSRYMSSACGRSLAGRCGSKVTIAMRPVMGSPWKCLSSSSWLLLRDMGFKLDSSWSTPNLLISEVISSTPRSPGKCRCRDSGSSSAENGGSVTCNTREAWRLCRERDWTVEDRPREKINNFKPLRQVHMISTSHSNPKTFTTVTNSQPGFWQNNYPRKVQHRLLSPACQTAYDNKLYLLTCSSIPDRASLLSHLTFWGPWGILGTFSN